MNTNQDSRIGKAVQEKIDSYSSYSIRRGLLLAREVHPEFINADEKLTISDSLENRVIDYDNLEDYALGIKNYLLGNKKLALNYFNKVISLDRNFFEALALRAFSYSDLGDQENSFRDLKEILNAAKLNQNIDLSVYVLYAQGVALLLQGDSVTANDRFTSALLIETKSAGISESLDLFFRGSIYCLKEYYQWAVNALDESLKINPENVIALILKGLILQENLKEYQKSIQSLSQAIKINPAHNKLDSTFFCRALCHYNLEDLDAALNDFNTVLECNPFHANSYIIRGKIHLSYGNFIHAAVDINRGLEIQPSLYATYQNLFQYFEESLSTNRARDSILEFIISIGDINYRLQKYPEAIQAYGYALAIDLNNIHLIEKINQIRIIFPQSEVEDFEILMNPPKVFEGMTNPNNLTLDYLNWVNLLANVLKSIDSLESHIPNFAKELRNIFLRGFSCKDDRI